jgi:nitrate/nitrite transporter NarK
MGQFLFAFGVSIRSYPVAVTGRAIFGLGGENLNVSCCYFLMKWFKNKNLALAMGITFSITRTASVLNENLLPVIVVYSKSLTLALWVGFSVCLASVLAGIILGYFDKKKSGLEKNEKIAVKFSWFEVKQLSLCFWMVCLNLAFSYASIFCFTNIGSSYLQHRFGFDLIEAGRIISITFIFATVLCPFIGVVVDRFGYLPHCVILANLIITTVHVGFLFVQNSHQPAICIVLIAFLGLGYSIYATCIWSMIPLLIKEELGGLANGISTASYNVGLALGPIGVGLLQGYHNEDNRYHWLGIFLILNGSLALFTSVVIYLLDFKLFRVLKNPARKNNEEDEKENLKSLINV